MTDAEQREAARQFANRWIGKGREDEDGRSYWIDLLTNVLGMDNATERLNFEKKVVVGGNTKRIDVYIPETSVIIEQKSLGKALDQKIRNSGDIDLTPFEQADRYNSKLTFDERARWIVASNFAEIWIYDMNQKQPEPTKIALDELPSKYPILEFLVKKDVKKISREMEVSIKAGDIVGLIYDAFLKQYKIPEIEKEETAAQKERREHKLKSLNALCVRIVFCLFAEDAGLFGHRNMFHDYLEHYDIKECRRALIELFKVLDTPVAERDEYLEEDLAQFPYVNGGLFADESIEVPPLTEEIKELLLTKASEDFNWSDISPTIFGAVFESTLNPETRRSGGMHYTSIENIHKVIDPLFLDGLNEELEEILKIQVKRTRNKKLTDFQNKLASLKFLDPACGSGNFLTETYLSLRRMENKAIAEMFDSQITLGEARNPIKVSIQQFYGIEINDFAVTVAKTALWIAESQMLEETKNILYGFNDDFLPLKTYVNITEGNALRLDWNEVIPARELSYIMGNPPFVGARWMSKEQKMDMEVVFRGIKDYGNLDFVTAWYKKASDYISNSGIRVAFVSTNTITQGEQPAIFWKPLFDSGIHIDFAYRTFRWDSEASIKAHVHCVIIGFSFENSNKEKIIFDTDNQRHIVKNINAYLIDADNIFVSSRKTPICKMPEIGIGNKPIDGGYYLFSESERKDFIRREPESELYFHPWYGAKEFINRNPRYCLYLGNCSPKQLRTMPECMKRVEAVKEYRLQSSSAGTRKLADTPTKFHVSNFPQGHYIVIPQVSSERRRYIPMGYMDETVLCSDKVRIMPDGSLYHFGILESNVHMAWTRAICGRLKSDYSYTVNHVYNNFPWPNPTEEQRDKIEQTAQGILDARKLYPDSSLADLYDPLTMPQELRKAHTANDRAVMSVYGFSTKMSEADCVAELMKMYQRLISNK